MWLGMLRLGFLQAAEMSNPRKKHSAGLEILNHPHVAIEFLPKKGQIPAVGRRNCPGEEGGFLLP
jgi:hypothetical protein